MAATPAFNRREFLKGGLHVGAAAAGIVGTGAVLAGCEATANNSSSSIIDRGRPTPTDWRRLASTLQGTLVLPSSPSYANDRLLYNSKFANLHPSAIVYCETSQDVARCIDFVTRHGIEVAARSGGHSYGGYSSSPGLVIDVSRLNSITVNTRSNVTTIGAGALLIDIYNALGNAGRLLPGGSCPTVGIAGLALGGGVGVFARKFGLTCDNLQTVHMISASGEALRLDESTHSDLLWASRGGGGGNFGVATRFEFTVHPMPQITLFSLEYPWNAATSVLDAWQQWISRAPDELWSNCLLLSQGNVGYLTQISGVYCGSPSALESLLAPLRTDIGTSATSIFVGSNDYLEAMKIEAGCSNLSVAACHLSSENPSGQLNREAYSAKSSFLDAPTSASRTQDLVDAVATLKDYAPTLGGGLAFDSYGGVINRIKSDQTAFVHRNKLAGIQATYSWSSDSSFSDIAAGERWLTWLGSNVFDQASGAYQNYIDPTLSDWKSAYYGANIERLVRIKKKYDPHNIFRFAQSIPVEL
jgi:hypothetical protein